MKNLIRKYMDNKRRKFEIKLIDALYEIRRDVNHRRREELENRIAKLTNKVEDLEEKLYAPRISPPLKIPEPSQYESIN